MDFSRVFNTNMLVSKAREKQEKITNARKTQEIVSILHYTLGKNMSLLRFSRVFARVFAHKPLSKRNPNA